jgi:hypothetical protein
MCQNHFFLGGQPTPDHDTVFRWITQAWKAVDSDTIRQSFKLTGVTTDLDGSEDDYIYYFQHFGQESLNVNKFFVLLNLYLYLGFVSV